MKGLKKKMSFKIRTTPPTSTDKNWIHTSKGGKNSCILISGDSVLPNCVGYAWGRFMEILGSTPKLSRANAEDWYGHTSDGYERGQTPKLGAVICWRKGKTGTESDGAGHVAIVEQIYSDGSIMISESGYNSFRFRIRTLNKPYQINGYSFQGFIYNPAVPNNLSGKGEEIELKVDTLKKGSTGSQVKTIQRILACRYALPQDLIIDGIFGNITYKYVTKFQGDKGLVIDGIVGEKTWEKLVKY